MSFTAVGSNQRTSQIVTLVTESCCNCHILFAFPADLQQRALDDKTVLFFCPKGHSQHYTSDRIKTLETQLQQARAESQLAYERRRAAEKERDHHWNERKKTNTRLRHLKERVKSGVCPCCHRTFKQLANHMAAKHPDFAKEDSATSAVKKK